ncbi:hypothetical protein [Gemmata sp.]|uniref:hypothetical protein n=1 Tax=Gemmata sp. TaxID=1914242 RepID=UPI003F72888A
MPNLSPRTRAVALWGLEGLDLRAALVEALAGAGLLPLPVDEAYEAGRKFEQHESGAFDPAHPGSVRSALYAAGLLVSFDAESDERPSPHDKLVMRFGRHSRGGFSPECAVQTPGEEEADDEDRDDEEDEDPEEDAVADTFDPDGPLRVRFVHAGRVYEFDPENFGDWYDVAAVVAAVNLAVADGGRPERFLGIETGGQAAEFVFADPARFLPVARRLALPVRRDAVAE